MADQSVPPFQVNCRGLTWHSFWPGSGLHSGRANHLDIKYQITLFDIIKMVKSPGKAVLAVHISILPSAMEPGSSMHEGRYILGKVSQVLTRDNLKQSILWMWLNG